MVEKDLRCAFAEWLEKTTAGNDCEKTLQTEGSHFGPSHALEHMVEKDLRCPFAEVFCNNNHLRQQKRERDNKGTRLTLERRFSEIANGLQIVSFAWSAD